MNWLIGTTLQVASTLPPKAARKAIRASTVRVLSDDEDSESCIGITFGRILFVSRTSWRNFTFVPGPVFRGTLQQSKNGSLLSGRFTIPLFSLVAVFLCACFAALIGVSIAMNLPAPGVERIVMVLAWILFCVPVFLFARWMLRLPWTYADRDQRFIERHLRQALDSLAE